MTLTEILPSLRKLSDQEKIKAIQFLAAELAKDAQNSAFLGDGKTYEVWSPYDAFSAEKTLTNMLQQHLQKETKEINDMTPIELYRKGFKALVDALGYVDAIRFIRQFDNGSGDYTEERHQWLDVTVQGGRRAIDLI
jgi:hypothetical protein